MLKKILAVCLVLVLALCTIQLVLPPLAEAQLRKNLMVHVPKGTSKPDITVFDLPAVKLLADRADSVTVMWREPPAASWPLAKVSLVWSHVKVSQLPQTEGDFYGETDIAAIGNLFDRGLGPISNIETSYEDGKILIAGELELQGASRAIEISALPYVDAEGNLVLAPQKMAAAGIDLNGALADKIKDILTFTLTADFLPGRLAVGQAEISADGKLKLWGRYVPLTPLASQ